MTVSDTSSAHDSTSRLKAARESQGLSLRELAYFAHCSHTTLARLEAGTLDVSPAMKARISRALRIPVADLWSRPQDDVRVRRTPGWN
jgi:transcriptional regulator with XRE-family HTH domain